MSDLHGSVEDLSSRCEELMSHAPTRDREELGEQLVTLKEKCENLEGMPLHRNKLRVNGNVSHKHVYEFIVLISSSFRTRFLTPS